MLIKIAVLKAGFHIAPTTALQHCCNNRGVRAQVYLYNSCMLTTESIQQPQLYGNQPLGVHCNKALNLCLWVTLTLLHSQELC